MTTSRTCPKCSGAMEEGFIVDRTYGGNLQPSWTEGPPEKNFWVGVLTRGKLQIPVSTYRCAKCGFLESYSTDATQ